jgi:hypothetical protein
MRLEIKTAGGETTRIMIPELLQGNSFYNAQFTRSISGMSPITNKIDTVQDINSLVLLNDSPNEIQFVGDNSMAFNAVLSPNSLFQTLWIIRTIRSQMSPNTWIYSHTVSFSNMNELDPNM